MKHYADLINGLNRYSVLYDEGLKKQANDHLKDFLHGFKKDVTQDELDKLLCRFCREYCDEHKHRNLSCRGNGELPFEFDKIVSAYLKTQCTANKMPQMRWAFEMYGSRFNVFNRSNDCDPDRLIQKAYAHKDRDQKTAELYCKTLINTLDWGAHHFPDYCLIEKDCYEKTVKTAEGVLAENTVNAQLSALFYDYVKLYECWYEYIACGKTKDFYGLCRTAGVGYTPPVAIFYKKK